MLEMLGFFAFMGHYVYYSPLLEFLKASNGVY